MALQWACAPFAVVDDVLNAPGGCPFVSTDPIADLIDMASDMLYHLTGGRIHGVCTRTVRPITNMQCGIRSAWGHGNWGSSSWGLNGSYWGTSSHRASVSDEFGGKDPIRLRGPNASVSTVTIDGIAQPTSSYVLVNRQWLIRTVGQWPTANDLGLPDTAVGTWSITYSFGVVPDWLTRDACVEMVIELGRRLGIGSALNGFGRGVVSANVQGVGLSIVDQADAIAEGRENLAALSRFLGIYAPGGHRETPAVWSPELEDPYRLFEVGSYS